MATALIHFDPKQKQRLARRAKLRGKSFSQEVAMPSTCTCRLRWKPKPSYARLLAKPVPRRIAALRVGMPLLPIWIAS